MSAKSHFIIGTAGHIDHGKTSLIKALTGMDTDRLKEEKERGISIDLGFAYLDLPALDRFSSCQGPDGTKIGIVDVPGHERFIKNMLAGSTGIDLVLFTIAADDGIMPQTKEHLDIMHLLGIARGIFVITKPDMVEKGRVDEVALDIKGLIKDTYFEGSPVIPVSSATGSGIDALKALIVREAKNVLARPESGFFRLPVDRSFSIKGFGTVVTGTVASGRVQKNDEALLFSRRQIPRPVKIRGIQSHFKTADAVCAGQRAALNLSSISHTDIERGDVLVSTDLDSASKSAAVYFEFLDSMKKPVKNHSLLKLHHMTDETTVRVAFIDIKEALPGAKTFGQIKLKEPMVIMRGDRFVLRDTSVNATIGGGRVLLSYAEKALKSSKKFSDAADVLMQYNILNSQDNKSVLLAILSAQFSVDTHTIRLMMNISENELNRIMRSATGEITLIEGFLILNESIKNYEQLIVNIINKYHKDVPGDIGINEEYIMKEVRSLPPNARIGGQGPAPAGFKQGSEVRSLSTILKAIMNGLISSAKVVKTGNVFHLSSYRPEAKGAGKAVEDSVLSVFSDKGINPVKKEDILKSCPSFKKEDIEKGLKFLLKRGEIIRVAEDSYMSRYMLDEIKNKLAASIAEKGKIKAAEFRDILGCGRKFAIELLEYFDKERITLRSGDYRVLRKAVKT